MLQSAGEYKFITVFLRFFLDIHLLVNKFVYIVPAQS